MTAIVQPVSTGGGGGGGSVAEARNVRGAITGLAPDATQTICSVQAGTRKLRGFVVHGDTDATVWIEVDNAPMLGLVARFSRVLPAYVVLPNPEPYGDPSATVALRVRNEGTVAGDFEGTLLGE